MAAALALLAGAQAAVVAFAETARADARAVPSAFPLVVDGTSTGDIPVLVGPGAGEVRIESGALLARLRERLTPEAARALGSRALDGYVSLGAFAPVGITATYDEAKLELRLEIGALARRPETVSLTGRDAPEWERQTALSPDGFSAFVNANAGQDFRYGSPAAQANGFRQPLRTNFDGAMNASGWVLESAASYQENGGSPLGTPSAALTWQRGDTRLVRDAPDSMVRYQAGDVQLPISGFQQFRPMVGLAATTDFDLSPYRITTPLSRYELLVKSHSIVKVYLNGRLMRTLELEPGRHDLRDLPVSAGVNDVTLEITDDTGRTETVRVPYIYSDQLLAEGINQLAYAIGLPTVTDAGGARGYDSTHLTYSLSHRLGLSDHLTLGAYAQGDPTQVIGGASMVLATAGGTWNLEPAFSRVYDAATGAGLRLAWLFTDYGGSGDTQRNLGLSVEARGPGFAVLGTTTPPADPSYNWSASYSQQLLHAGTLTLAASWLAHPDGDEPDTGTFSASFARGWTGWARGLDTSLTLTSGQDATGAHQNSALLFITWAFPEKRQTVSVSANTQGDFQRAEWSYNPASNLAGGTSVTAGAQRTGPDGEVDAQASYTGNRGVASLVHQTTTDPTAGVANTTGARAGASLLFAGGHVAIGRPVTDSFVLVSRKGSLGDSTVLVNPQQDGLFEARADGLGPAAATQLVSYRYTQLRLAAPDAPPGVSLPKETFVLLPGYKSGKLIEAGAEGGVLARGRLVRAGGVPAILWSGEARLVGEPAAPPVVLFTNRSGSFALENLKPGRYEVRSFQEHGGTASFEIPVRPAGVFDMGEVGIQQ
jgi:outer membrane usher protein